MIQLNTSRIGDVFVSSFFAGTGVDAATGGAATADVLSVGAAAAAVDWFVICDDVYVTDGAAGDEDACVGTEEPTFPMRESERTAVV